MLEERKRGNMITTFNFLIQLDTVITEQSLKGTHQLEDTRVLRNNLMRKDEETKQGI